MAKRIVYIGSFNNYKKGDLINRAITDLKNNRGNEFYYILPNGELLREYRSCFIGQVGQAFEINLFTFDDIVSRVLEGDFTHIIDNPTKNLILRNLIKSLTDEGMLTYYKNHYDMQGFVKSMNDILGDIKRSLVYPDEYLARCPKNPFYEEIGLIYAEYERILENLHVTDREGAYLKSARLLEQKEIFSHVKTMIIDEFYDFRPIELAILEQLTKTGMDIIINMPYLTDNKSIVIDKTLEVLSKLGFQIEYIYDEPSNVFEKLGKYLFVDEVDVLKVKDEISIINGATPYLELRKIFEEVKKHHHSGIDLGDIGIIISNSDYLEPLYKVSAMERIPLSINKTSPLKNLPIARELLTIMENKLNSYPKSLLINRIKSSYFEVCPEDKRDLYELFLRREDFSDIKDLEDLLESNKDLKIPMEEIESLNSIIDIIKHEANRIPSKSKISIFNQTILSLIDDFKIRERIVEQYRDEEDEDLFLRDFRTIDKIEEVIEKMDLLIGFKDEITIDDYYFLLVDHIEEEAVIELEGNINGLHILDPINSRGTIKEIIFITGLAQGSYPALDDRNYFINDYNYKDLKSIGIDVKSYGERLDNEGLKFASIIASCKKKLYLSYSSGYDDSIIKSLFLEEVISLIKKDKDEKYTLKETKVNLDYLVKKRAEDITNFRDLLRYIISSYFMGDSLDSSILNLYNEALLEVLEKINEKVLSEVNRYGNEYDEYRGVLVDETIIKDIKSMLPKAYSISYLEAYSRCPYFFLLNNIFKVEQMEREFEDYSPRNLGNLYHEVLRKYYETYSKEIENSVVGGSDFDFQDTISNLKEILVNTAPEIGLNLDNKKDLLVIEVAIDKLRDFIEKDVDRIIKDGYIPYEFEKEFGKYESFILNVRDRSIPIIGQIDRIDKLDKEDKYIAIDYKSSSGGVKSIEDMESGLSLQLPVYILSQEGRDMVAGAYSIINNAKTEIKLGLKPFIRGRGKSILTQEEWDRLMLITKENIYNILSNIEKGDFRVEPQECSPYCIYKDICRYRDVLEVE